MRLSMYTDLHLILEDQGRSEVFNLGGRGEPGIFTGFSNLINFNTTAQSCEII